MLRGLAMDADDVVVQAWHHRCAWRWYRRVITTNFKALQMDAFIAIDNDSY